jgi:polar amino acid transport system substrate-binding protein
MRQTRLWTLATTMVVALVALAIGGCGGGDDTTGGGSTTANKSATPNINVPVDKKVAAEVPQSIKSNGTLTVAEDAEYAPNEFIAPDGHTIIGMDADLAKALAQAMGLEVKLQNVVFESIIPGLAAKKYDLGMSSFTATTEREKTVDFVTYAKAGTSFYVRAQGGPSIQSLADLCGENVSAQRATTQQTDAEAQDKKCKAQGKPGVSLSVFPDQNSVNLALASSRVTVAMADSPVAAYAVDQSKGQFKLSGSQYSVAKYGIAIPKGTGLAKPVLDALKAVIADGTYDRIFDYWGLLKAGPSGCPCAISNPQINPTNIPAS